MTMEWRHPRSTLGVLLAVALVVTGTGATAVAASPDPSAAASPVPVAPPVASPPAGSDTTLLRAIGRAHGGCGSPNGCAWFLQTVRDGDTTTRIAVELRPISGGSTLVPGDLTPMLLTPGSYVATAIQWRLGPSTSFGRTLAEIDASCPLPLPVAPGPPSVALVRIAYRAGACEMSLDPGAPTAPQSSPAPDAAGGPTPGTSVVTSDDGRLTVELPDGAAPSGVMPTATAHGSAALPPELVAMGLREPLYTLEPRGQGLQLPVVVRETFDVVELPVALSSHGLAPIGLALRDPSGAWSWLEDQHITRTGRMVTVSGLTTQLGDIYAFVATSAVRAPRPVWAEEGGYQRRKEKGAQLRFTLQSLGGSRSTATFRGDWRFGGAFPRRIGVQVNTSEAGLLLAHWRCLKVADTELSTTFGFLDPNGGYGDVHAQTGLTPLRSTIGVSIHIDCVRR
jgi:hypothetical protein